MRKREEQAIEKRELKEKAFQEIKNLVHRHVFSDPELLRDLSIALRYGSRNQEQQDALFEDMVQNNAEFCLIGDPSFPSSPSSAEQECRSLIKGKTSGLTSARRWSVPLAYIMKRVSRCPLS